MSVSKRRKNDVSTGVVPLLWFTVDQAAEAFQLSYYTTVRMCKSGEIAATKFGREWRVPVREVEAVIDALMQKSAETRAALAAPAA